MPPFILEAQVFRPLDYRRKTTLHCKRVYSPIVKVSDWENDQISQPIDNNPYCPEGINLHCSHYKHFGTNYDVQWSTTTGDMLREVLTKRPDLEMNPNPPLVNIYTSMKETCNDVQPICRSTETEKFSTTMQHSYQPPYPYKLKRLAMPKIPHLLNRRLKSNGSCKFMDDDYNLQTRRLQTNKSSRFLSYNPCTGNYTNEVLDYTQEGSKCVDIKKYL
ncbi:uncharacterized protein [Leptinotarsa decemlineata]|uniref:uncharacterized protein n=1 Tax=Leptinotarsa decemlineata TaxID=7539 RepID=UPI000C2521ED|nr:uncharacterized protein LOC111503884 [Leptinotarsa decemlineata]